MKSNEIRAKRGEEIDAAQAVQDLAVADGRDLTADEQRQIDEHLDGAEKLMQQVEATEAVENRNARLAEAQATLTEPAAPAAAQTRSEPGRAPETADQTMRVASPVRQLRSFRSGDGVTREADQQRAHLSGMWLRAVAGHEEARDWCRTNGVEYRVATEGTNTSGGYLVPDVLADTIISNQSRWGVARNECQVVNMSSDVVNLPKQASDSGVTANWIGEASTITASDIAWNQVSLTAKKLASLSRISTELLEDSVINLADFIASDAAIRFSEAEDDAWINGDGTSTYGGIVGVKGFMDANEGFATVYTAAAGVDTYGEVTTTDLSGASASLAPYAHQSEGVRWYVSQAGRANMFERLGQAGGGTNVISIQGGLVSAYSGYPVVITNKLNNNPADDLSEAVMVIIGNMEQACVFGDRRVLSVKVLNERYADTDEVGIQVTDRIDIVYHDRGSATATAAIAGLMGD